MVKMDHYNSTDHMATANHCVISHSQNSILLVSKLTLSAYMDRTVCEDTYSFNTLFTNSMTCKF